MVKLLFTHSRYECSDGCCVDYCDNLYINDELMFEAFIPLEDEDIERIFKAAGVEYSIEHKWNY